MAKRKSEGRPGIHVESHNQQGGITAHTVNVGTPDRTLGKDVAQFVQRMSAYKGTPALIACNLGDGEAIRFGSEIRRALEEAGWDLQGAGVSATLLGFEYRGIGIRSRAAEFPLALRELAACLLDAGFQPECSTGVEEATGNDILILGK